MTELPEEPHVGLTHLQNAEFLYEARLFPSCYTFETPGAGDCSAYLTTSGGRALHADIVAAHRDAARGR